LQALLVKCGRPSRGAKFSRRKILKREDRRRRSRRRRAERQEWVKP
jgi:hypothetical protein